MRVTLRVSPSSFVTTAETLREAFGGDAFPEVEDDPCRAPEQPLPSEALLLPLVAVARRRLERRAGRRCRASATARPG